MALLKRFELWLLLILIAGGLYYVLNLQPLDKTTGRKPITRAQTDPEQKPTKQAQPRFSLQKTTLSRDGDHFLAQIEIECQKDSDQTLLLNPPDTQLLAAGAREVPVFFLPFHKPTPIPESKGKTFTLRYWLTADNLKGPLTLKIAHSTLPIKTGEFKTDDLPDQQSRSFTSSQWVSKPNSP